MPEYLAPGVYVEEIDTGSKPIEGVSTSTAGMIGVTERGPSNIPILITSFGEFRRWFGEVLNRDDFSNGPDPHCYLPHAVEGFFTNGGKRVYVTRIEHATATRASRMLFDRGGPGSVESMLIAAARQGSGTAVSPPAVAILQPGTLGANDWIRIGQGSQAEYRQIVALVPNRQVPLNYPLERTHDAGAPLQQITATPVDGSGGPGTLGPITLVNNVAAGDSEITVTGAAADLAQLALNQILEVGTDPHAEYRYITAIDASVAANRGLTLDEPLVESYPAPGAVRPLKSAPIVAATTLGNPASAGAMTISGTNLGGAFDQSAAGTQLVVIDGATPTRREARRIGAFQQLTLTTGAYDAYSRGARVDEAQTADDNRQITAPPALATQTVLTVSDVTGLAPGQRVIIDPAGIAEPHDIQSVDAGPPARITLTAPIAGAVATPVAMNLAPKTLTAPAPAGANILALDNRLGLGAGDLLRVGAPGVEEYVRIASLVDPPGGPPDAGAVALTMPTQRAHPLGATLRRQVISPAPGAHHPAFTILNAAAGSTALFVTDNDAFGVNDLVRVRLPNGVEYFHHLGSAATAVTPTEVQLNDPLEYNHEAGAAVAERAQLMPLEAIDTGSWGNRLRATVEDEVDGLVSGGQLRVVHSPAEIELSSLSGVEEGTVLELAQPNGGPVVLPLLKVQAVNRNNGRLTLQDPMTFAQGVQAAAAIAAGTPLRVRSREFRLGALLMKRFDPANPSSGDTVLREERFDNLSMDPRHSRYFRTVIGRIPAAGVPLRISDRRTEGASWLIRVEDTGTDVQRRQIRLGPEALVDVLPSGTRRPARHPLSGGNDRIALLNDADYVGQDAADPDNRTGLQTLKNVEEISIVASPGRTNPALQTRLIAHCEEMRYRFAVLDAPPFPRDTLADVRALRQQFDTKYAALYHPWLLVPHPYPPSPVGPPPEYDLPPSGHVVGVYARTDVERGVHKAPANEVVRGITGLRRSLNKGEHDILNPSPVNINVIRDFRPNNRGIRIWGGRVITSDTDWKYVNVRRLLIFIEHSIDRGLQWVVFEPNAEPLWARVRRSISNFLRVVWRNGALEGTTEEEAYFVKCDRTTMTQTDIDSGRLICVIGVAPVKPAEYVIIQIGLWTAHADS